MNGMFMNSRGIGDLAKHLHIAQCIRDHNLDFMAISYTGRRDFLGVSLTVFQAGWIFTGTVTPPRGRSGGILLGVN